MNKNTQKIKEYFTADVQKQIKGMSSEDMANLIRDVEGTPLWFAMLKYTQDRIGIVQDSLLSIDPVKEPTQIARYQGMITGMLDFQDVVLTLKFNLEEKSDPKAKKEKQKEDLGGAYGVV